MTRGQSPSRARTPAVGTAVEAHPTRGSPSRDRAVRPLTPGRDQAFVADTVGGVGMVGIDAAEVDCPPVLIGEAQLRAAGTGARLRRGAGRTLAMQRTRAAPGHNWRGPPGPAHRRVRGILGAWPVVCGVRALGCRSWAVRRRTQL